MNVRARVRDVTELRGQAPGQLRAIIEAAARHHTPMLAAGLAFFGLVSLAPAIGFGLGALRLLAPDQVVSRLVDAVSAAFGETLAIGQLLQQMEDQAARYAGLGLVALLWPATTLASGWRRALDAVYEHDSPPVIRSLAGRAKGLSVGLVLLGGALGLLAAMVAGTTLAGQRLVLLLVVAAGGLALQFLFCLLLYRLLPAPDRAWSALWPGAVWATAGVAVVTVGFALLLSVAESAAQQYPPTLSTAVVLGLWLYGANLSMLLGAELNAQRMVAPR